MHLKTHHRTTLHQHSCRSEGERPPEAAWRVAHTPKHVGRRAQDAAPHFKAQLHGSLLFTVVNTKGGG